MGQIQGTLRTVLAFVRTIDKGGTRLVWSRPVTREDVFKAQRWHIQALNRDRERHEDAADEAAAVAEEASEGEDSDKSSSSSSEEEVEEDKGVAHEGQLMDQAQEAQLIMGIEYCQNTAGSQKLAGKRVREAKKKLWLKS
jgi:hypothetical protein